MAADLDRLIAALRDLAPSVRPSVDKAWSRQPAVRVIDCVLSLNRNYYRVVTPRLDCFEQKFPEICSVAELTKLIASSLRGLRTGLKPHLTMVTGILVSADLVWLDSNTSACSLARTQSSLTFAFANGRLVQLVVQRFLPFLHFILWSARLRKQMYACETWTRPFGKCSRGSRVVRGGRYVHAPRCR